jgi:hypothetical protein
LVLELVATLFLPSFKNQVQLMLAILQFLTHQQSTITSLHLLWLVVAFLATRFKLKRLNDLMLFVHNNPYSTKTEVLTGFLKV